MSTNPLAATLEALRRGERPPCPLCNEAYDDDGVSLWHCGSSAHGLAFRASHECVAHALEQVAAQRAEIEQLRHLCARAADRMFNGWEGVKDPAALAFECEEAGKGEA